jgi:crotonobetainyl-CoA:carnitine CoA-transferase CaiB-like acyl-CoA transferase
MWWAGPSNPHVLAALGADVVKVESCEHCDPSRLIGTRPTVERWWEYGPLFHTINVNRRGITLDLNHPDGKAALFRLAARADLIMENYTPRVMGNFGLTPEVLLEANPRLLVIRMPAFGLDGPWRDRTGFAQTMEAISGIAGCTGLPDNPPILPLGVCDPMGGVHAAFGALVSLFQRERDGKGRVVECTMVEAALNVGVETLLHYDATGEVLTRNGNRDLQHAPQGIYRCLGEDGWVAVTVQSDEQWAALGRLLDDPSWMAAPALATAAGRLAAHDAIDEWLDKWFVQQEAAKVVELLVERGIPAAEVIVPRDAYFNPQLRHRRLYETEHHPVSGHHVLGFTVPFRMTGVESWIRRASPTLGQHNDEVLREAGYTAIQIGELRANGVIGDRLSGY